MRQILKKDWKGSDRDGTDIEEGLEKDQIGMGQILKKDWRRILRQRLLMISVSET